jgi:hypothetical protein
LFLGKLTGRRDVLGAHTIATLPPDLLPRRQVRCK